MVGTRERDSLVPAWLGVHRHALVSLVLGSVTVMVTASLVLGFATHLGAQPFAPQHPVVFVGSALVIAAYAFVFALLVGRLPGNAVGWVFGLFALMAAVSNLTWAYLGYATETVPPRLSGVDVAIVIGAASVPLWPLLFIALITLFPDGRPLSRGWGRLVVAAGILAVATALAIVLGSGPLPVWIAVSPIALTGAAGEASAGLARLLMLALALLNGVAVWSLLLRYRASDEIGRLQLKWLIYAGAVFAACALVFLTVTEIAAGTNSFVATTAWLLLCFGAIVVPLAALAAILRYHLYGIDTIIGRTLVYGGLTAILAGIYAAALRFFTWMFELFTGQTSDAVLVLTTLLLTTSLTPIKAWLEHGVAARWNPALTPVAGAGAEVDGRPAAPNRVLDPADERIARRAAAIVIDQLGVPTAERVEPTDAAGSAATVKATEAGESTESVGRAPLA